MIRGWCFDPAGGTIIGVRVQAGGRTFNGIYGDGRDDVRAAFGDRLADDRCGYEVPVTLRWPVAVCSIQVQFADGSWRDAHSIALGVSPAALVMDRFRWSRLWAGAELGRGDALNGFTEAERDHAVATARVRGWFNLDVVPQYPARTLIPDELPSRLDAVGLPELTVVTPSFQQGSFLEQTIRSVLEQRGVQIRYVVQDGGSTDGSVEVIRRYADRLAHWQSAIDEGQAAAVARGFAHGTGKPEDIMMFLNADDLLMPGAARFVAEFFATNPDVDVVYGHRIIIDETSQEVGRWITPRSECLGLQWHDFIPQETLFWRRRIWDRVGGIDRSLKFALDWDLLLRFEAAGACFARLPWFLGAFRLHPQQKTATHLSSDGVPEMNALRQRTFGRPATHDELHLAMRRAQLDSALVFAQFQRGRRG
jgi:hypothetical protein